MKSLLLIFFSILINSITFGAGPTAVPTFNCLGVYWSPAGGDAQNECEVKYRVLGSSTWQQGFPLWFDDRNNEYRGSIVHLDAGETYEINLNLASTSLDTTFTAETWGEDFPISQTVYLPQGTSSTPLNFTQSGTASGYVLYTHPANDTSIIDVNNLEDYCITVDASYIIIRGVRLKGAIKDLIHLNDCNNVIIEDCDMSTWGSNENDGWGVNRNAAIRSTSPNLERIIVQRNKIHHPRSDANNWMEPRVNHGNNLHPRGPQAVDFNNSKGNHVIRYNEIYSDSSHYYNDALGGGSNFSEEGFPNRDSDIYGNYIAHCWDDGIESEGANCNVRIWGNYIDSTFVKIAVAATATGPMYIWRNVSGVARQNDIEDPNVVAHGGFLKTSDGGSASSISFGGKIYVFHNTILQPDQPVGVDYPLGCDPILGHGGPMLNTMTRNNILHISKDWHDCISDNNLDTLADYDYDLFNGDIEAQAGSETNGIYGVPVYNPIPAMNIPAGTGVFTLDAASPGFDSGLTLFNFNDTYNGAGPDMGAHEAGTPPMEFGTEAYLPELVNGINELNDSDLMIYPNPTTGLFIVEPQSEKDYVIEVMTISGQILFKTQVKSGSEQQIDLSDYAKGTYLLKLTNDQKIIVEKVVLTF